MPQHDESRVAGRHRRVTSPRHRRVTSPRHRAAPALQLTGERGRTAVLTATLSAALVAGVAGGAAAAQAAGVTGVTGVTGDATATRAGTPSSHLTVVPPGTVVPDLLRGDLAPAKNQPRADIGGTGAPAGIPAAPARLKVRERPKLVAPIRAAWVNPNQAARVTSCFGQRWGRLHAGIDLAAPDHTPIVAAGAGVVVRAGAADGYGNAVLIDHGNGYLTHYGHLSEIEVRVGERVAAGDEIGKEGSTGHSTGPHLHFEVHQGSYKNPIEPTAWMREHGVEIIGCATPADAS